MLRSALFLAGAVLSGCSDPAAPAAGTFRAQLRGVRLGTQLEYLARTCCRGGAEGAQDVRPTLSVSEDR